MIAAIYARKSTEQNGVVEEQRSVARQIEHARAYAIRKGWDLADEHVYVDDGISGAEFLNRPGFVRLMASLKPRPPFQVLVMSEESRLGREAIETAYALKQLITAGVRVFFYLEDRERTLDSPTDKIMLSLTAFADELEREKARQRTYDAMSRKARAGHVTGGRVFGYDNVNVAGPAGKRSHVERQINQAEAAVVRRIFELYAKGHGLTTITKTLNAEGALAPRPQHRRPTGWAPSSVREILYRDLYRGLIVWNKTRKRNRWGQIKASARPAAEWCSVPAPHLRIVSDVLWTRVHDRLADARAAYLRGTGGELWGRPSSGVESKYLLAGLTRCASCNGGMYVKTRAHGRRRVAFYGCSSYRYRGTSVCKNKLEVSLAGADAAVLEVIEQRVLTPEVITTSVQKAIVRLREQIERGDGEATRLTLERRLATVERELGRLTEAITAGGRISSLIEAMRAREAERASLRSELAVHERAAEVTRLDVRRVERELRAKLDDWTNLLRRQAPQARQVLKKLLVGPIVFEPKERSYEFRASISLSQMLRGTVLARMVASPSTLSWNQIADWLRQVEKLRRTSTDAA